MKTKQLNLIGQLSNEVLAKVKATLEQLEPEHELKGGFTDNRLDDLYFDIDFEESTRHFVKSKPADDLIHGEYKPNPDEIF